MALPVTLCDMTTRTIRISEAEHARLTKIANQNPHLSNVSNALRAVLDEYDELRRQRLARFDVSAERLAEINARHATYRPGDWVPHSDVLDLASERAAGDQ